MMYQNANRFIFFRGKIVSICEAVLAGEIGVIAASRRLWRLGAEIGSSDLDFDIFVAIDSETDHLPVDGERRNWCPEALVKKDAEILEYELRYEARARDACLELILALDFKD